MGCISAALWIWTQRRTWWETCISQCIVSETSFTPFDLSLKHAMVTGGIRLLEQKGDII